MHGKPEEPAEPEDERAEPGRRIFLLRLAGELYTKARPTRLLFLRRLERNLADALRAHGISGSIHVAWSRAEVRTAASAAAEILARVFGVQSVAEALRRPWRDLDDLVRQGAEIFRAEVAGRTFAVRARRLGARERIPFTSQQIEIELGRALAPGAAGVDLERPEVEVHVEAEPGRAHFFRAVARGPGGLPLGTAGRAVVLVSGGVDSAVAAWSLLRRGVELDYVFANLTGTAEGGEHRLSVLRVLQVLADRWSFGSKPRLHEIDFAPLAAQIQARAKPYHAQVLLKRFFLRAADRVAREVGAIAVATGDSIAQVSSQTLQNLAVADRATDLLVLRPLAAQGKEEILARGREIGVALPAAEFAERCDLAGRRPATRARLERILADEGELDLAAFEAAILSRRILDLRALEIEPLAPPEPGGTADLEPAEVLLDLRARGAFEAWHHPAALHLDFERALAAFPAFARDRGYALVCEVGWKSGLLAARMRAEGFAARVFPGGLRALMKLGPRSS